jgi:stearoyl-CoA desaturase (Delta-9 desaturase)
MNEAGTSTARVPASGVMVGSAMRLQRGFAFLVMVLPILGTFLAVCLGFRNGLGKVEILSFAIVYLLTMGGMTIGLHRYFAHRTFDAGPRTKLALAILGSMAAQGPLLSWVTIHRKHHAFSDRPGDPHSPHIYGNKLMGMLDGLWHAHIEWMFTENAADWSFSRDLVGDRSLFWVHRTYLVWVVAGLLLPAAGAGLLTRSWTGAALGFLWGGLVRCFVVNQASWCVGSVCHYFGSQRFETHDHSANNYWVALFTFGEGLQNNHHAFPSAARHGMTWWEPDFSGTIIRLLAWTGLVRNTYHPSPEAMAKLRKAA